MTDETTIGLRPARIGLAILNGFLGLTAISGGLGLLLRAPFVTPPLDLLAGSPFGSYALPGLALLVLVGGSATLATAMVLKHSPLGLAVSGIAGLMILIFEGVELVVVGFTWLLAFYVALGLAILGLAAGVWLAGRGAAADAGGRATAGGVA
jgi:hypothetical protein